MIPLGRSGRGAKRTVRSEVVISANEEMAQNRTFIAASKSNLNLPLMFFVPLGNIEPYYTHLSFSFIRTTCP